VKLYSCYGNTVAILRSIQADCSCNWKMLSLLAPQKHESITPMYVAKRLNFVFISSVSQDKIFLSAAFANSLSTFMMITLKLSLTPHYTVPIKWVFHVTWSALLQEVLSASKFASLILTPCKKVLLEMLTVAQLVNKLHRFYGIWRFVTVFKRFRH
jgi:hypothetical protein